MKSKTKIEKQLKKKQNQELVRTIIAAKKAKAWASVAEDLSRPTRKKIVVNLDKINSETKAGDTIVVPGKILSWGNLERKVKLVGLSISDSALEKVNKGKSEFVILQQEIKLNPEAKGIKIIK